jgi:hypothetical protein
VEKVSLSNVLGTDWVIVLIQKSEKLHDQMPQLRERLPIHVVNQPTLSRKHDNCKHH